MTRPPAVEDGPEAIWAGVASQVRDWAAAQALDLRELVVLLPMAPLLAPLRRALSAQAGWLPRVETTASLAESLGPPPTGDGGPSGDSAVDRLNMAAMLRQQPFGVAWQRRDPRGFSLAVQATVAAAQELGRAAQAHPPTTRDDFWTTVHNALAGLGAAGSPGGLEAALLRVGAAWAAAGSAPLRDRLFALRPSGWVVVRIGGLDPMAEALIAATADTPRLQIDLDADIESEASALPPPRLLRCDDQEAEALAAAAQVLEALDAGAAPVALVALDRILVRRVRALLERAGVSIDDETGWRLSTTRAAARLMAWLRAAAPGASTDDLLDWLKGWPPARDQPKALQRLEARWRRPSHRSAGDDDDAAGALWARAQVVLGWSDGARERPLAAWLAAWRDMLQASDEWAALADDAAGAEALRALRLDDRPGDDPRWDEVAAQRVDLGGFTAWVDEVLEEASFVPPAEPETVAEVIVTPMVRTPLRPFGAVVVPGADGSRLGTMESARGLIGEALAAELGLPTLADRRRRERLAFLHLLRQPRLTLIRRRLDGDEPVAMSADVLALDLLRRAAGQPALDEQDWAPMRRSLADAPVPRPEPRAPQALPSRLSASQVEALRACPYRFFGRAVLRLVEDEELDRGAEKRDYGNWLHAVLHRFHADCRPGGDDAAALAEAALRQTETSDFDAADLLPFLASFESFAPAYLDWLAARDTEGWAWQRGETLLRASLPSHDEVVLLGRIDRIDARGDALQLIDYKTGSATSLAARMKPLAEDTQLAFYAALVLAHERPQTLEAAYLTLDDPKAPKLLPHADVAATAARLLAGLDGEWQRLRDGEPMPPLGEGEVCEHCEMRGLCRRDHWSEAPP